MIYTEKGLYVRPVDYAKGQGPKPLASGFSEHRAYRVLGGYAPSELGEYWLIVANDDGQIWFITNQHWRVVGVFPDSVALDFPLMEGLGA